MKNSNARISRTLLISLVGILLLAAVVFATVQVSRDIQTPPPPPGSAVPVTQVSSDTPMTPQELNAVLGSQGIHVYRFNYQAPYDHSIVFTAQQFYQGKSYEFYLRTIPSPSIYTVSEAGLSGTAGQQTVTITTRRQEDKLAVAFNNAYGGGTNWSFDLGTLQKDGKPLDGASYYDMLENIKLTEGHSVPIFFYGVTDLSNLDISSHLDLQHRTANAVAAVVIYAELRRAK